MFVIVTFVCALGVVLSLLIIAALRHKPEMIFDKYPQKGLFYHIKYAIALILLKRLRHKIYKKQQDKLNEREYLAELDKPQPLTDNPQSYDVVSFMAANAEGYKLVVNLERRRRGVLKSFLYLWTPDQGLLCSPKLPDMLYFTTDGDEENLEFKGNGCHIYPEANMHCWCIRYDGSLRSVQRNEVVRVKFDLKFSSNLAHFDYNRDLSASVIADSVAREAWNSRFFRMLRNVDAILDKRTHYEQNGVLEGTLSIDEQQRMLKLHGLRDHSFGTERCLSTIHRYVYFSIFLNDGTSMVIGNLSQPSFFLSSLKVGYICTPQGDYQPITQCNFELYSYGEKGKTPKHQNFIVQTAASEYFVQIKVEEEALRYNGGDWESKVFNQFVSCTVNGVKGYGLTEYLYRNTSGRPEDANAKDPEWYRQTRELQRSLSRQASAKDFEEMDIF